MEYLTSVLTCLSCSATSVKLFTSLLKDFNLKGILIPPSSGKSYISQHLVSDNSLLVDLDNELTFELSEEEKTKLEKGSKLQSDRLLFLKAEKVIEELASLLSRSSKSTKNIIFISSNYKLLKFVSVADIEYFCPSDSLVEQLALKDSFKKDDFEEIKKDLLNRKKEKTIVYTSIDDLSNKISDIFKLSQKV